MRVEGLLQGIELADATKAFDRLDRAAIGLHRKHQARSNAVAIDQHRAGAANAVLAADMRTGEPERLAQEIGEQQPRLDCKFVGLAIDGNIDVARSSHAILSVTRFHAALTALPVSTPARCRR